MIYYRSGCSGERRAEDIKEALEDNFPDVKYTEFFGRTGIPFLFHLQKCGFIYLCPVQR